MKRVWPLILAGLLVSGVAHASGDVSIFARLATLEERAITARHAAEGARAAEERTNDRIEELAREMSVASRAARPIRDQISRSMKEWLGALNASHDSTWQKRDTAYLLGYAAPRALRPKLNNVHLLELADSHRATLDFAVGQRAQLSVQLAQATAEATSAEVNRKDVLENAGSDRTVKADLARTDGVLEDTLKGMMKTDGVDFHRYKGALLPPVSGRPDVSFGAKSFGFKDVTTRHTGLTWRVPGGTEVKATGGGVVALTQTFEGFGNLVIVDHGGGYHSVYAHLDRPQVSLGERVSKGTLVGLSGDTGSLEGAKVYFELRHNAQAVDPTPWFVTR